MSFNFNQTFNTSTHTSTWESYLSALNAKSDTAVYPRPVYYLNKEAKDKVLDNV